MFIFPGVPNIILKTKLINFTPCRSKPKVIRLLHTSSVCENPALNKETQLEYDDEVVGIFNKLRDESYNDQITLYRNLRKEEVFQMADKIVEGKKRKLQIYHRGKR